MRVSEQCYESATGSGMSRRSKFFEVEVEERSRSKNNFKWRREGKYGRVNMRLLIL